jgi:hypothetical protein
MLHRIRSQDEQASMREGLHIFTIELIKLSCVKKSRASRSFNAVHSVKYTYSNAQGSINLSVHWTFPLITNHSFKVSFSQNFNKLLTLFKSLRRSISFHVENASQEPSILSPRPLKSIRLNLDRLQIHFKLPIFTSSSLDPPLAPLDHTSALSLSQHHGISTVVNVPLLAIERHIRLVVNRTP